MCCSKALCVQFGKIVRNTECVSDWLLCKLLIVNDLLFWHIVCIILIPQKKGEGLFSFFGCVIHHSKIVYQKEYH